MKIKMECQLKNHRFSNFIPIEIFRPTTKITPKEDSKSILKNLCNFFHVNVRLVLFLKIENWKRMARIDVVIKKSTPPTRS